jgi:hypothetical protein
MHAKRVTVMQKDAAFVRSIMSIFDPNEMLARPVKPIIGIPGRPRPDLRGRTIAGGRMRRGGRRGGGGRSQQNYGAQASGRLVRGSVARRGEGGLRRPRGRGKSIIGPHGPASTM